MNHKSLTKHYSLLTPEERFRLILAAGGRNDETERDRLTNAGQRITLSAPDHSPYGHAFQELTFLTYIELLEEAARYLHLTDRAAAELRASIDQSKACGTDDRIDEEGEEDEEDETAQTGEEVAIEWPKWHLLGRASYATGFVFKVKMAGWKLFCERWNAAPFVLWELGQFPGLARIEYALALANSGAAFPSSSEMAVWMNEVRPAGDPEQTEADLISPNKVADGLDTAFHERIRAWGG